MLGVLFLLALGAATFVGFNIGGSSTGVAWGPAVGANIVNKVVAAGCMTFFFFLGGWTLGREVIDKMGVELLRGSGFPIAAAIVVLAFIGLGMLVANVYGVPVSTSMTAVGAIAGYGFATERLRMGVLGGIVIWWIVAPVIGFWCGAVIGRYLYPTLDRRFAIHQSAGPLLTYRRKGPLPAPELGPGTTPREFVSTAIVFAIACYMSFSAGASNTANAVAPLVGGGQLGVEAAVLLGTAAMAVGAFTIARRTMESVGNGLTALPLVAATVVMVVAASITSLLSWAGIPMSLAMSTVMCIVGLGWGRATRTATARELVSGEAEASISVDAITAETPEEPAPIGEVEVEDVESVDDLFDPGAVVRFTSFWIIGPSLATILAWAFFTAATRFGFL